MKITLVQADLDEIKQEQERNNASTAAKLMSSIGLHRNHAHVRKKIILFFSFAATSYGVCVCVILCFCSTLTPRYLWGIDSSPKEIFSWKCTDLN